MRKRYYDPNATYTNVLQPEPEVFRGDGTQIVPSQAETPKSNGFARRDFLKGMGVMVVGFSVAGRTSTLTNGSSAAAAATEASGVAGLLADPPTDQVDSYLVIRQDGSVTGMTSLMDLGQGITQQYIQWIAEELDVSMPRINIILGDTALVANDGAMNASRATNAAGAKFRRAAASARVKLLQLAGERFGVSPSELTTHDGVIFAKSDATKSVSYAELISGKRFEVQIPTTFDHTKPWQEYKIIGQPIARADIPAKLTGEQEYVHDVRVPGMVHARAIRPRGQSYRQHSVLENVDMDSVAGMPGLIKVVPFGERGGRNNFVGVVCEREEQAIAAAAKLKVTWGTPPPIPGDLYQHLLTVGRTGLVTRQNGDLAAALAGADKVLEATYKFPFQMHAPMGSACGVADVKVDSEGKVISATAWSASQNAYGDRTSVGTALGIPAAEIPDKVRLIWKWGPGIYGAGGTPYNVACTDAALLSKAVGRPVRVQWFREDTHGWESYGPIQLMNLRGGIDSSGKVVAYDYDAYHSTGVGFISNASTGERYTFGRAPATFKVTGSGPAGGEFFLTATLRAPQQPALSFAAECFIDEMAAAAKADPIQFRLNHFNPTAAADARAMDVLNTAADKFGWDDRPSPNPANVGVTSGKVRGRGVAYGPRSATYVAHIYEVEVDLTTGWIQPIRCVVAHDIGLVANPESMNQQIEGNVIQTISRSIWEEVKHDGYRVSSLDWISYPFLTAAQVPKVETVLINRPELGTGSGGGEASAVAVVAALGNAIFDATGVRLRQVPFTPERVLEALKNQ